MTPALRSTGDAHIHLFERGWSGQDRPGSDLARYERLMGTMGITAAIVVGYEGLHRHRGNNAYIARLARSRPWMVPLEFVSPHEAVDRSITEKWAAECVRGASLYLGHEDAPLSRWSRLTVAALGAPGTIISVNVLPGGLGLVGELARVLPDARILVSHLGGEFEIPEASPELLLLAEFPHVGVKLSGLYAFPGGPRGPSVALRVKRLLDEFGAARLLWGSDYPPALAHLDEKPAMTVPDYLLDGLDPYQKDAVAGGNLRRLITRR